VLIDQAREIPRAVDAIFQASFARYGYALITKSGVIFPRTLVDRCSPQPERLLFECGAVLTDDLDSAGQCHIWCPVNIWHRKVCRSARAMGFGVRQIEYGLR
jgi:hypothetical protein